MLRLRKYRIFLLVALFSLTTVWYLSRDTTNSSEPPPLPNFNPESTANDQQDKQETTFHGSNSDERPALDPLKPQPEVLHPNNGVADAFAQEATTHTSTKSTTSEDATTTTSSYSEKASTTESTTSTGTISKSTAEETTETAASDTTDIINHESTTASADYSSYTEPANTWIPRKERFPISSTIKLPTATPRPIPRIQHTFEPDTPMIKNERKFCLDQIRKAMKRTWAGYKQYAWMKDELRPVSKTYHDKFMGWAATLVDSLDTLWIMGLEREFEEAVNATATINFKESFQSRIPMFETTIRYLGGLLGAYDITGGDHKVLLEKAVELAEVLMGAFDTPNRMPILYYNFAAKSQPNRAGRASCLAELGSLSIEFTRLAQLTGDSRYYDAIARITDSLAEYQMNTAVPGLWPLYIDTSGCKQPKSRAAPQRTYRPANDEIMLDSKDQSSFGDDSAVTNTTVDDTKTPAELLREQEIHSFAADSKAADPQRPKAGSAVSVSSPAAQNEKNESTSSVTVDKVPGGATSTPEEHEAGQDLKEKSDIVPDARVLKRQLGTATTTTTDTSNTTLAATNSDSNKTSSDDQSFGVDDDIELAGEAEDCTPAGLQSGNFGLTDHFSLGGEADSTYEYLPKQYILLGGNEDKYRTMYEAVMEATKKFLLFRPMQEDNQRELLFTGGFSPTMGVENITSQADGSLATQMGHLACFVGGMLALGAKIFDRPEELEMAAKVTDACVWAYGATASGVMPEDFTPLVCESIDNCSWNETAWHEGLDPYWEERQKNYQTRLARANITATTTAATDPVNEPMPGAPPLIPNVKLADLDKRQLDMADDSANDQDDEADNSDERPEAEGGPADDPYTAPDTQITTPKITPPMTHAEYVALRIKNEGLWPGALSIHDRRYILRPEAIESVFYMYRITGDQTWRRKGLKMWMALEKATATDYGNSAIKDVTDAKPDKVDEMESFWPAETLKYFYLLFADQDLCSLDDWVL